MREQRLVWFWVCEYGDCGWKWLAEGVYAPEKCSKCKRRGWHVKGKVSGKQDNVEAGVGSQAGASAGQDRRAAEAFTKSPDGNEVAQVGTRSAEMIAGLRDICAGKLPESPTVTVRLEQEIPICGHDWWEDVNEGGEHVHFECLMDKGHRTSKHGQGGMVRKLDD